MHSKQETCTLYTRPKSMMHYIYMHNVTILTLKKTKAPLHQNNNDPTHAQNCNTKWSRTHCTVQQRSIHRRNGTQAFNTATKWMNQTLMSGCSLHNFPMPVKKTPSFVVQKHKQLTTNRLKHFWNCCVIHRSVLEMIKKTRSNTFTIKPECFIHSMNCTTSVSTEKLVVLSTELYT